MKPLDPLTNVRRTLQRKAHRLQDMFWLRQFLDRFPDASFGDAELGFLFSDRGANRYRRVYLLLAYELARRGYPSGFLFHHPGFPGSGNELRVEGQPVTGSLIEDGDRLNLSTLAGPTTGRGWDRRPEEGIIEADGTNVFNIVNCTLQSLHRRYTLDYEDPTVEAQCDQLISLADIVFDKFDDVQAHAKQTGTRMRIVGYEPGYAPNGIFELLCRERSQDGLVEYVDLSSGYMHYFGGHFRQLWIATANMTRTGVEDRAALSGEEFDRFAQLGDDPEQILQTLAETLSTKTGEPSPERERIVSKIEETRRRGGRMFILFSHLFYDAPPDDSSRAFPDMCAWIQATVDHLAGTEDLLLLKPHPAEAEPEEDGKEPAQTLESFITRSRQANVEILDPHAFSTYELSNQITCGLVWRSTVGLELIGLGTPAIIAGAPRYRILDLGYPETKEAYFEQIERAHKLHVSPGTRLDAARYIYFLREYKHTHPGAIHYDADLEMVTWSPLDAWRALSGRCDGVNAIVDEMLANEGELEYPIPVSKTANAGRLVSSSED